MLLTLVLVTVAACSASSEPLQFADWTIPVPDGTPVHEYAHVPEGDRTGQIELVEDLVIGGARDDPKSSFFEVRGLAVDSEGAIYVLRDPPSHPRPLVPSI